jgi:hypothetical protein
MTLLEIIGTIYLLTFWFDLMNSFVAKENFYKNGLKRLKVTYEPFKFFVVAMYNRFFKKEQDRDKQSVG